MSPRCDILWAPRSPRLAGTVVTAYATGVALMESGHIAVSDRENELIVLGGPLRFAGEISYGLYLWHPPLIAMRAAASLVIIPPEL